MCPFFRQSGGDGLVQGEDNLISQCFNIPVWISQKKSFRTNFFGEKLNGKQRGRDQTPLWDR
jgi:hypothetical protein